MRSIPNLPKWFLLIGGLVSATACAPASPALSATAPQLVGHAALVTADGRAIADAVVRNVAGQITVTLTGHDLTAGPHGLHLHAVGKCEGPAFASAGPHLNPGSHQHGAQNPAGAHLGDLPNLVIGADGSGSVTFALPGTPAGVTAALFDTDGSALVVHAGEDDYRTDPSGNSGARIACGVLTAG